MFPILNPSPTSLPMKLEPVIQSDPPCHCPGPQTIVRGSKGAKDGALTLLLDEFENMSVTRSNSLRRDSPPPPTRARQENGMPTEQAATARGGPEKAGSQGRGKMRNRTLQQFRCSQESTANER